MPPHHHPHGIARWRALAPLLSGGHRGVWGRRVARQRALGCWAAACEGTASPGAATEAFALWLAAPPATAATLLKSDRFRQALLHGAVYQGPLAHATGEMDGWWDNGLQGIQVGKLLHLRHTHPALDALYWLMVRAAWTPPHQAPADLWDRLCTQGGPPLDTAAWLAAHAPAAVAAQALDLVLAACPMQPAGGRDGSILDDPDLLFGSPRLWCALEAGGVRTSEDALVRMEAALMGSPWRAAGLFGTSAHAALRRQALIHSKTPLAWLEAFGAEDTGAVWPNTALHAKMSRLLLDAQGTPPHMGHERRAARVASPTPLAEDTPCAP